MDEKLKPPEVNRCVCCGAEIPEGRLVCPKCERKADDEKG